MKSYVREAVEVRLDQIKEELPPMVRRAENAQKDLEGKRRDIDQMNREATELREWLEANQEPTP